MAYLSSTFNFNSPVFAQITVPSGMPVGEGLLWSSIIPGVIKILLLVAFVLSFIYLLLGGISWITSGGDREALASAKKKVTYAVLGLVLVLLSFALLGIIGTGFGVGLTP